MNASPRGLFGPTGLFAQPRGGASRTAGEVAASEPGGASARPFHSILGSALSQAAEVAAAQAVEAGALAVPASSSANGSAALPAQAGPGSARARLAEAAAGTIAGSVAGKTGREAVRAAMARSTSTAGPRSATALRAARERARASGGLEEESEAAAERTAAGEGSGGTSSHASTPGQVAAPAAFLAGEGGATKPSGSTRSGASSIPSGEPSSDASASREGEEPAGGAEATEPSGGATAEIPHHAVPAPNRRGSAGAPELAFHAAAPAPAHASSGAGEGEPRAESAVAIAAQRLSQVRPHQARASDLETGAGPAEGGSLAARAAPRAGEARGLERKVSFEPEKEKGEQRPDALNGRQDPAPGLAGHQVVGEQRGVAQAARASEVPVSASAALPPPPAGSDVQGAVLASAAHLKLDAGNLGVLELHLRMRDGAVHLRMEGDGARALQAQAGELSRALANEGLRLGSVEASLPQHAASGGTAGGRSGEERREAWEEAAQARELVPARGELSRKSTSSVPGGRVQVRV